MYGNNGPFSYSPRGFSQEDFPQQRRAFLPDDLKGAPPRNNMSRPSGKSIYMQRKEYSESLNRKSDNFHVRVEHLFTCELDGQEVKTVNDCVAKLKRLDAKGRVWPQEMIMEVEGGYLLLSDIETKTELESLPLSSIVRTKAVLDSCAYNSLLTITVQERRSQVFMFQCEETGAELIKSDLDKAVKRGGDDMEPHRYQSDIRSHLENIIGQHAPGYLRQAGPHAVEREMTLPPLDHPAPQWHNREPESMRPPWGYTPQEEMLHHPDLHELQSSPEQTDAERNTDILNHVLNDLEIFIGKVSAAANRPSKQKDKSKKEKKSKENGNILFKSISLQAHVIKEVISEEQPPKGTDDGLYINSTEYCIYHDCICPAAPVDSLPPCEEYMSCLQKIKYGLNLLGQLDRSLTNPSAPDFVHIFFTSLGMLVPQYPADLPPAVLSPLLTEAALRLLSQVVGPEEDQLWRSLGDSWNIPRSRWQHDNVPPYIPEFYDGWQPPAPSRIRSPLPYHNRPVSRGNEQRFPSGQPNGQINESQSYSPRARQWQPEEPVTKSLLGSHPPTRSTEPHLYMQVIYDFRARNNRELSVLKGEVLQVIQKSKQWWLVCNARNEKGNVPQNVLEPMKSAGPMENLPREIRGPVTLDMSSTSAEVKAWLQYKGFSKITVTSLGVLTGKLLLGMTKDEIRTVCPEEGGKVFFQLQAIKSAIALASEPSGLYNGRY
ncbi:epidermal growth factor receptor kinase substrate 8-like protein 3b [Xiphias gladius]|uniref:epidermal growth factor receptor kinase substrate 8-like protein 3b n=1 Tax=Xiphias gladius TaxID=8245 RepID=UPI001A9A0837|nr:epidermal growth factor receptor kinase substrate 8-like protein 3b [Xiphias gladius]